MARRYRDTMKRRRFERIVRQRAVVSLCRATCRTTAACGHERGPAMRDGQGSVDPYMEQIAQICCSSLTLELSRPAQGEPVFPGAKKRARLERIVSLFRGTLESGHRLRQPLANLIAYDSGEEW